MRKKAPAIFAGVQLLIGKTETSLLHWGSPKVISILFQTVLLHLKRFFSRLLQMANWLYGSKSRPKTRLPIGNLGVTLSIPKWWVICLVNNIWRCTLLRWFNTLSVFIVFYRLLEVVNEWYVFLLHESWLLMYIVSILFIIISWIFYCRL